MRLNQIFKIKMGKDDICLIDCRETFENQFTDFGFV